MRTVLALAVVTLSTVAATPAVAEDDPLLPMVRARMKSLERCGEEAVTRSTKATVSMEVQPGGDVSQVTVGAPPSLAACVAGRVRSWKFPPFSGAPRWVSYPVVFIAAEESAQR